MKIAIGHKLKEDLYKIKIANNNGAEHVAM